VLTAAGLVLAAAGAQEPPDEPEPAAPREEVTPETADGAVGEQGGSADESTVDPELEDADLDDQTYESDDDVFVPSEEIPADEPIPFPSDI
jgi:hypothetical protein